MSTLPSTNLTAIVLTFNSAHSVGAVLDSLQEVASRVVVVDSGSSDGTQELVAARGAEWVEHPFDNYSRQRRWAEEYAQLDPGSWVLHVDSDEVLSIELAGSIRSVLSKNDPAVAGYLMRRLSFFWGRPIRYGHMNPSWHLRLYRAGQGTCEDRLYDQHYVTDGPTQRLEGALLDLQLVDLTAWTASHNRWSSAEASEALQRQNEDQAGGQLRASLWGDTRERKRWLKNNVWYRLPALSRAFLFFFYSFVLKRGFLDGRSGAVYHVLHAFWFRFLVDAKMTEVKLGPPWLRSAPPADWLIEQGANGVARR